MLNYQAPVKKLNSKPILSTLWEEFKSSYKSKLSKAQFYAEKRGIENTDLGYNAGRWHNKKGVTEQQIKSAQEIHYLLPSLSGKGHKVWAKECLIFALRNAQNEVVSFYGRSISQSGHFYLKKQRRFISFLSQANDPKTNLNGKHHRCSKLDAMQKSSRKLQHSSTLWNKWIDRGASSSFGKLERFRRDNFNVGW